jgi:phosphatidate cytidylyltransferase
MALNIATFKTRAATAGVFVLVMLTGLLWNYWSFFILFSIIHFGCWIEYQKLVCVIDKNYAAINPFHKYGVMIKGWCIMFFFTHDYTIWDIPLHTIVLWPAITIVITILIADVFSKQFSIKNIGWSAFGLLYISLSIGLLTNIRFSPQSWMTDKGNIIQIGFIITLGIIFSIWINDTMAYIVGSLIGKTPFSKISPKKTWEGTIGGAILCVLVISLLTYWIGLRWRDGAIIAAIVAVFGTAGDLFESKLKRMANLKDSGSIMPGHGGFLDRFDSLLIATPFVWLYVILMMKLN